MGTDPSRFRVSKDRGTDREPTGVRARANDQLRDPSRRQTAPTRRFRSSFFFCSRKERNTKPHHTLSRSVSTAKPFFVLGATSDHRFFFSAKDRERGGRS